ncbi:hypothetical protein F7725_025837 [Dissostichus mawsoni]|uniref:PiggyBac transposable element-derived protein domain-containing protein n=1 Tax=Dissostichus mawsoni TaxID=36200 RepID=A0A7J5X5E2_DISMA|nr:hypothetical protein F7725_025837 [Dissostichus mawsoni]
MAARKKTLLSVEEALELVFEDSPSEDGDLVTHEGDSNDSDYEPPLPERLEINKTVKNIHVEFNTNAKALKRLQAGKKMVWKVLTQEEFFIFLDIIIFSGLVHVHQRTDYWRTAWPYNFSFPADKMSRNRFETIMWSLHISNPEEDEENDRKRNTAEYDRLFKVKPLYTEITAACKAHFQPYQNISIDERMVASKARSSMKQYMKDKPTKWGFKLFVLADSSTAYTWNFFVYAGKSEFTQGQGLSYSSVIDLLPFSLLGAGYKLFVDNFYTSPALFGDLSTKGIGCCGTIRKNRVGFPHTELNDLPKKAERGDLRWIRRSKLLFVKWMDSREVNMCSTVHKAFSGQTVRRNVKERGVWQTKNVTAPDAVLAKEMVEFSGVPAAAPPRPPTPPPSLTCVPVYYGEDATTVRRYCRKCSDAGNRRVKTPVYCRKCQVPLCFTPKKNLFTARLWKFHRVVEALGSLCAITWSSPAVRLGDLDKKAENAPIRAILLKWKDAAPPTCNQWLRDIMSCLNFRSFAPQSEALMSNSIRPGVPF